MAVPSAYPNQTPSFLRRRVTVPPGDSAHGLFGHLVMYSKSNSSKCVGQRACFVFCSSGFYLFLFLGMKVYEIIKRL